MDHSMSALNPLSTICPYKSCSTFHKTINKYLRIQDIFWRIITTYHSKNKPEDYLVK